MISPDSEEASVSVRRRTWRTVCSVFWALIPLLSLGILAVIPVLHAALKLRHSHLWLFVVAYLSATVFALIALPPAHVTDPDVIGNLAAAAIMLLMAGGTVHAFMLRPRVFGGTLRPGSFTPDASAATQTNRPQPVQIETFNGPISVEGAVSSRSLQQPQRHPTIDSNLGADQPERLSKYQVLILVVTVVVGLLTAAATIAAAALFR